MRPDLVILRGLPGSGKSFLAEKLRQQGATVCATDDFHGQFPCRDASQFRRNHHKNQAKAARAIRAGRPVVIDNTNILPSAVVPYVRLGKFYGYSVRYAQAETPWAYDARELARRNRHGVGIEEISEFLNHLKNYPLQRFKDLLELELGMDPRQILRDGEQARANQDRAGVLRQVGLFQDWRRAGGFLPKGSKEALRAWTTRR